MNGLNTLFAGNIGMAQDVSKGFESQKLTSTEDFQGSFSDVLKSKVDSDSVQHNIGQNEQSREPEANKDIEQEPKPIENTEPRKEEEYTKTESAEDKNQDQKKDDTQNSNSDQDKEKLADNKEEKAAEKDPAEEQAETIQKKKSVVFDGLKDGKDTVVGNTEQLAEKVVRYKGRDGKVKVFKLNTVSRQAAKEHLNNTAAKHLPDQNAQQNQDKSVQKSDSKVFNLKNFEDNQRAATIRADHDFQKKENNAQYQSNKAEESNTLAKLFSKKNVARQSAEFQNRLEQTQNQNTNQQMQNPQSLKMESLNHKLTFQTNQIVGADQSLNFDRAIHNIQRGSVPHVRQVGAQQQIMNQLTNAVKVNLSQDNSQMTLKLKPDYLGEINMKLQMQTNGVSKTSLLTAVIEVDNHAVKDVLQTNLHQLKQQIEDQNGIAVKKFEIFVKSEMPQMQDQQQQLAEQKGSKKFKFANIQNIEAQGITTDDIPLYNSQEKLVVNGYSWTA